MIKDIMNAVVKTYLVIIWYFLLPFVYLLDRLFFGWKDEKKEKTIRQSKRD